MTTFLPEHYRDLISMVETDLAQDAQRSRRRCPRPAWAGCRAGCAASRSSRASTCCPTSKAQRWLLSISASDRAGLLYSVARVLARHHLNLQLAKVTTLGERVEDTFLISGPELQGQKAQLAIETELLEALAA